MDFNKTHYQEIVQETLTNGGFSQMHGKYMVALKNFQVIVPRETFNWRTVRKYHEEYNRGYNCLGTWYNPDNDNIYLDISIPFRDKEQAIKFAKHNNQLAIYDTENDQTIYL